MNFHGGNVIQEKTHTIQATCCYCRQQFELQHAEARLINLHNPMLCPAHTVDAAKYCILICLCCGAHWNNLRRNELESRIHQERAGEKMAVRRSIFTHPLKRETGGLLVLISRCTTAGCVGIDTREAGAWRLQDAIHKI